MRGFISSLLLLCFFLFLSNLQFCSGCCVLNNAINNGSSCECSYNGINTTFSEQIIVVENSLLITNPEPSNFLSLNLTSNTSAWFNQTSGFSIKATVFNVSLEPIYTDDEDRSGYNDNAYQIFSTSGQAQLDYLNILNTSCRYPVPNYYSVNVQQVIKKNKKLLKFNFFFSKKVDNGVWT